MQIIYNKKVFFFIYFLFSWFSLEKKFLQTHLHQFYWVFIVTNFTKDLHLLHSLNFQNLALHHLFYLQFCLHRLLFQSSLLILNESLFFTFQFCFLTMSFCLNFTVYKILQPSFFHHLLFSVLILLHSLILTEFLFEKFQNAHCLVANKVLFYQ